MLIGPDLTDGLAPKEKSALGRKAKCVQSSRQPNRLIRPPNFSQGKNYNSIKDNTAVLNTVSSGRQILKSTEKTKKKPKMLPVVYGRYWRLVRIGKTYEFVALPANAFGG